MCTTCCSFNLQSTEIMTFSAKHPDGSVLRNRSPHTSGWWPAQGLFLFPSKTHAITRPTKLMPSAFPPKNHWLQCAAKNKHFWLSKQGFYFHLLKEISVYRQNLTDSHTWLYLHQLNIYLELSSEKTEPYITKIIYRKEKKNSLYLLIPQNSSEIVLKNRSTYI